MWRLICLLLLVACSPLDQSSVRTVAAIEVPITGARDEADLIALLRRHADADPNLHLDDGSAKWRAFKAETGSLPEEDRLTVNLAIWRGENDDEPEVLADDRYHPRRVWITFMRGSDTARSTRFRQPLLADLKARWPASRSLPILPHGGLPHSKDLIPTDGRYLIRQSAASRYDLPASSPLVSRTPELSETAIDRFEAQLTMPSGAHPLNAYRRVYAGPITRTDEDLPFTTIATPIAGWPPGESRSVGVGVLVIPGEFTMPDPTGRFVEPVTELPSVVHGGCDVVNVVFDPDSGRTLGAWCNVDDRARPS